MTFIKALQCDALPLVSRNLLHTNIFDKYLIGSKTSVKKQYKLDDIVHLPSLLNLPSIKIAEIWREYFLKKPFKSGFTIPYTVLNEWRDKSQQWPSMIIPLMKAPRLYENYFVQHSRNELGVVLLSQYQQSGPLTNPAVIVQLFDEMKAKDIGLILIHFIHSTCSREEAESLVKGIIQLYICHSHWPQKLNEMPKEFVYNEFIEDFQKIKI